MIAKLKVKVLEIAQRQSEFMQYTWANFNIEIEEIAKNLEPSQAFKLIIEKRKAIGNFPDRIMELYEKVFDYLLLIPFQSNREIALYLGIDYPNLITIYGSNYSTQITRACDQLKQWKLLEEAPFTDKFHNPKLKIRNEARVIKFELSRDLNTHILFIQLSLGNRYDNSMKTLIEAVMIQIQLRSNTIPEIFQRIRNRFPNIEAEKLKSIIKNSLLSLEKSGIAVHERPFWKLDEKYR